ncbi:MAG: nitroreductase family protein [Bryobacteraceae bacterium]
MRQPPTRSHPFNMSSSAPELLAKPASAEHAIHELLSTRWSPRAYAADRPVEPELLAQLFEAARWAPSSSNEQPWSFIVGIKGNETWDKLFDTLVSFNQTWAKNAPVLVLGLARKVFQKNGSPNRHAMYDLGQAVSMLLVHATSLGLITHQMAGFDPEKARAAFHVPDNYDIGAVIAIGYQADPTVLPPELRERETAPRTRNSIGTFVFEGEYGKSAEFLKK